MTSHQESQKTKKIVLDPLSLADDVNTVLPQTTFSNSSSSEPTTGKQGMIKTFGLDKSDYEPGFETKIAEVDTVPKGLSEEIISMISEKKNEPVWMKEFRLNAFREWKKMKEPHWAYFDYPTLNYQDLVYYSAPKSVAESRPKTIDDVDIEIRKTMTKLGIPLEEQKTLQQVGMDVVWDSLSVFTTQKEELSKLGIIFCSISEAVRDYPKLVQKYLASVVPIQDNFFAALNSAVFSDGSFAYIPPHTHCPIDLSTYFRINSAGTGQFERTLVIADEGATVSYLEGCTAPKRSEHQLHAAVVELIALDGATVNYSTVQNWYPGDKEGRGGIYNFVTKRGDCRGKRSRITWTQVETGSALTWKYPSCLLRGDYSTAEFHSVAVTNNNQQADTGTRMIHLGKHTHSTIVSKGISAGHSNNVYRGKIYIGPDAIGASTSSKCDSLLIGDDCGAHTFPTIESSNPTAETAHEATTSKITPEQLLYCAQRGIDADDAVNMIVNGFAKDVLTLLPLEFAAEARNLLGVVLEGATG